MLIRAALVSGVCAVTVVGGSVIARGQTSAPSGSDSLTAIASEVHLLRESVEKSANTQIQVQALGVYLSAQQSRLVQTANRADSIRRDLDAAVLESQRAAKEADSVQLRLNTVNDPPEVKTALEQELVSFKQAASLASVKESQLRARDSEASQALQAELDRWNDLMARLEQTIKK